MLRRFWRFCFRLLYNELAWSYDLVSGLVSLGHWRSWQRSALRYIPAPDVGPILELAHGTGDLQIDLARLGYSTIALDRSPNMGRLAQRKLQRDGLPACLVRSDGLRLPFRANAFAAVVCTFPTSFIFSQQALDELARVLQPSGCAVVVLIGQLHGRGPIHQLIRVLHRITGQANALIDHGEAQDYFASPHFHVESHLVEVGASTAQVVLLTADAGPNLLLRDISLDFAGTA